MRTAYKLFKKRKDGSLGSLFINKKVKLPKDVWLEAEAHQTKGFKFRPFWHAMVTDKAPHLSMEGRVWCLVRVDDYTEMERPESQGGTWLLAKKLMILGELT